MGVISKEWHLLKLRLEKKGLSLSLLERVSTLENRFILLSSMLSMILMLPISREYLLLLETSSSISYFFLSMSRSYMNLLCFFSLKLETQRK